MMRGKIRRDDLLNWHLEKLEPRNLLSSAEYIYLAQPQPLASDISPLTEPGDAGDQVGPSDPSSSEANEWTEWVQPIEVQWDGRFGPEVHTDNHFSGTVSTFTLADNSTKVTAEIEWGDGQKSVGQIVNNGDGTFSVVGSHDYAEKGALYVSTTISDGNYAASDWKPLLMGAAGMTSTFGPHAYTTASPDVQDFCVGMFVDPSSSYKMSDYTITINWGDGTTSAGELDFDSNGNFYVSGSHAYLRAGSFTLSYDITKSDGTTMNAQGEAQVWEPLDPSSEGGNVVYMMNDLQTEPLASPVIDISAAPAATNAKSNANPPPAAAVSNKLPVDRDSRNIDDLAGDSSPQSVL